MNRRILICLTEEESLLLQKILVGNSGNPEGPEGAKQNVFSCRPAYFHNPGLLLQYFREQYADNQRIPLCILEISSDEDRETLESLVRTDPDVQILRFLPQYSQQSADNRANIFSLFPPLREDCILALTRSLLYRWNEMQSQKSGAGEETGPAPPLCSGKMNPI